MTVAKNNHNCHSRAKPITREISNSHCRATMSRGTERSGGGARTVDCARRIWNTAKYRGAKPFLSSAAAGSTVKNCRSWRPGWPQRPMQWRRSKMSSANSSQVGNTGMPKVLNTQKLTWTSRAEALPKILHSDYYMHPSPISPPIKIYLSHQGGCGKKCFNQKSGS